MSCVQVKRWEELAKSFNLSLPAVALAFAYLPSCVERPAGFDACKLPIANQQAPILVFVQDLVHEEALTLEICHWTKKLCPYRLRVVKMSMHCHDRIAVGCASAEQVRSNAQLPGSQDVSALSPKYLKAWFLPAENESVRPLESPLHVPLKTRV